MRHNNKKILYNNIFLLKKICVILISTKLEFNKKKALGFERTNPRESQKPTQNPHFGFGSQSTNVGLLFLAEKRPTFVTIVTSNHKFASSVMSVNRYKHSVPFFSHKVLLYNNMSKRKWRTMALEKVLCLKKYTLTSNRTPKNVSSFFVNLPFGVLKCMTV